MTAEEKNEAHHKAEIWTRVIGGAVGALVLALQGVNISETSGQTHLIQRLDKALDQQISLTKEINQEGVRIDKALQNQQEMIQSMEVVLRNQAIALDLLKEKKTP